jgi:hypothetical protein
MLEVFRIAARSVQGVEGFSATTVNQPFYQGSVAAMKERGGNPVAVEADQPFTGNLPLAPLPLPAFDLASIQILTFPTSSKPSHLYLA